MHVERRITTETRESSTARVPAVPPGRAIVFTRYQEENAVAVNPEDFRRLAAIDKALDAIADDRPAMSDLALAAHRLEDEPVEALEDAGAIRALLDL